MYFSYKNAFHKSVIIWEGGLCSVIIESAKIWSGTASSAYRATGPTGNSGPIGPTGGHEGPVGPTG